MTQQTLLDTANNDYLLQLFKREMIHTLTEEAINAIQPNIAKASQAAIDSIEPRLRSHFEPLAGELIVQLVIKDSK